MCQACYDKGYKDYPNFNCSVDHAEDYKRGYKTKQYEKVDPEEFEHTFFCEKCYKRGLSNGKNGLWAPPASIKRGHYESYEKGYNKLEVVDEEKVPEYHLPDEERNKTIPPAKKGNAGLISKIVVGAICVLIGAITTKLLTNLLNQSNNVNVQKQLIAVSVENSLKPEEKKNSDSIVKIRDTSNQNSRKGTANAIVVPVVKDTTQKKVSTPLPPTNINVHTGKFPVGSERIVTEADIKGLSRSDLKLMRNEIFARHGYIFKAGKLDSYFLQQPWYHRQYPDVKPMLSPVERDNIDFIKKMEK